MIVVGIIGAWFAVSVLFLLALARAASRRVPTPTELFGDLVSPMLGGYCDETPTRVDIQDLREAIA
jgi:hypothetical protein